MLLAQWYLVFGQSVCLSVAKILTFALPVESQEVEIAYLAYST